MRQRIILALSIAGSVMVAEKLAWAATEGAAQGGGAHGLNPMVLVGLAAMLIIAKLGGELFERINQPAVLGELVGGMLVGALAFAGLAAVTEIRANEVIGAVAEIGVIILLFEVGLESNLKEMMEVGWSSLLVAVVGVIAPFFLGWGVATIFLPDESQLAHIFIGATLCATSVGITARVLKDIKKLHTREARIVLGAAVIDDVLGLLILAVVAGAIKATSAGEALRVIDVGIIAAKSIVFLLGAILVGQFIIPHLFKGAGKLETRGVLLALSIAFCFLIAWIAAIVGLAPIVGAFAAGLVLDEAHFKSFTARGEQELHKLIAPVSTVLVPIFFVLMGLRVDLSVFARGDVLGFAALLTVAAIIGKQVCGLAVAERGLNRVAVGLGMIPRGEVGLIFAGIGASLMLPNNAGVMEPVINSATFGAVVVMVIITTLVTPPVLKWSLMKKGGSHESADESLDETAEQAAERTSQ